MTTGIDNRRPLVYNQDVTETVTYRVVDAPKLASMYSYDCAECGHPELGRPVFLSVNGGGAIAVGTGCAAKLTGEPVAKFEADLAEARLRELVEAHPFVTPELWSWFSMCLPGRVTPKFKADTVARFGYARPFVVELVDEVAGLYKSLKRVGSARVREVKFA